MLYVGHFSFKTKTAKKEKGHFTCMVESEDVKSAIVSFMKIITKAKEVNNLFSQGAEIYVDAIIEIRQIPDEGVLTYFEESISDVPGDLNATLLYPPENNCTAYSFGKKVGDDEFEDLLFLAF